jgi:hypothetical protein
MQENSDEAHQPPLLPVIPKPMPRRTPFLLLIYSFVRRCQARATTTRTD